MMVSMGVAHAHVQLVLENSLDLRDIRRQIGFEFLVFSFGTSARD